ncbi:MAG: NAD(P)H-binding protein [Candidatus Hydrogenedentota bacterium]
MNAIHAVTGAFGYSGKFIASRLLEGEHRVITLTHSPNRPNPFGGQVTAYPYDFEDEDKLAHTLTGVEVLYNTYWVRFNHWTFSHGEAVQNTRTLFHAARKAGVGRIVHVSITNPSLDSPFEYFRSKAELEYALENSGIPHTILRPAILFGHEDILVNNIAWGLRRFPLFPLFGAGDYGVQPIHVEDFARLALQEGQESENRIVDAVGPETFTYRNLVKTIAAAIGKQRPLVSVPPALAYVQAKLLGLLVGDVVLSREEIDALMADLLCTDSPPAGETKLTEWAQDNADSLGRRYASELARRRRRDKAYSEL